jgi:flagellin
MSSNINFYLYSMSGIYNRNSYNLGETLLKLSSGKKFQNPADDVTNYFRSKELDNQYSQYENIKQNLVEWQGALNSASTAGGEVYTKLQRMKDLSTLYPGADAPTKASYTSEFDQLRSDVGQIIDLTNYGAVGLMDSATSLTKIDLVPDATGDTQRLDINPGETITAAHITALTPGGGETIGDIGSHIDDAIADIQGYSAKVGAYLSGIQSHVNISESVMSNTKSVSSLLSDTDDAEEMMNFTKQEIRQQAAIAMISQANMVQRSVLSLYQFGR